MRSASIARPSGSGSAARRHLAHAERAVEREDAPRGDSVATWRSGRIRFLAGSSLRPGDPPRGCASGEYRCRGQSGMHVGIH